MTVLIGLTMLLVAALLLAVAVGHDARTREEPANAGSVLATLVAAVAVVLLFMTGAALLGVSWVLSVAGGG